VWSFKCAIVHSRHAVFKFLDRCDEDQVSIDRLCVEHASQFHDFVGEWRIDFGSEVPLPRMMQQVVQFDGTWKSTLSPVTLDTPSGSEKVPPCP